MPTLTAPALRAIQRQVGHITVQQLAAAGIGHTARARLVEQKVLQHPHKSVYRVATRTPSLEQRLVGLSLAHPSGFVTGPTGGGYLGLRRMPRSSMIHFCLPHGLRVDLGRSVRLRQSTAIAPADRRVLATGLALASWPRLLFDLSADLSERNLGSVIDQVLSDGHCSMADLGAIARRLCHPRRHGSERFAKVLLERGDRRPAESHPELLVLEGLLSRGVPVQPQMGELTLPNGRRVRLDLAVPDVRWAVEVDVHSSHGELVGTTRDKRRDRQLHRLDWQVEHVTEIDLLDIECLLDELADLYLARCSLRAA